MFYRSTTGPGIVYLHYAICEDPSLQVFDQSHVVVGRKEEPAAVEPELRG